VNEAPRRLVVGEAAPQIALTDSEGNQWRSEDHRGQTVVVIFHRHIH
jgi:peroxiredoxin